VLVTIDPLSEVSGQSVLVTGGAGFIGSQLAATLADICDVTVLDDLSTSNRSRVPADVEFVAGDVRDPVDLGTAMRGTDVVFHQAAMANVQTATRSPVEGHRRTASGTVKVLDAARREDVRVVTASSAAIYGEPDRVPIHESDPKTPTSPYGIDKLAADQHTRAFEELYGLPTVTLRYFNVYGSPENQAKGVISAFVDRARSGAVLPIYGDGTQTRDFVHVEDVVHANLLAATTDETGRAYNIGTGTGTTIQTVAERVKEFVDTDAEIVHGSPRSGDIKHSRASISRARSDLGYEPSYSFLDGLESVLHGIALPN